MAIAIVTVDTTILVHGQNQNNMQRVALYGHHSEFIKPLALRQGEKPFETKLYCRQKGFKISVVSTTLVSGNTFPG